MRILIDGMKIDSLTLDKGNINKASSSINKASDSDTIDL